MKTCDPKNMTVVAARCRMPPYIAVIQTRRSQQHTRHHETVNYLPSEEDCWFTGDGSNNFNEISVDDSFQNSSRRRSNGQIA
mmetsp:Transcript_32845/g.55979  ORF Transcript_32845/g.55979 Transcript_32845/m.55979 type:complete len:82 (+) Transcript_32845:2273-2518(+)